MKTETHTHTQHSTQHSNELQKQNELEVSECSDGQVWQRGLSPLSKIWLLILFF